MQTEDVYMAFHTEYIKKSSSQFQISHLTT